MGQISEELQMLDDMIMEIHDRIRSGRCLTNKQQNLRAISFLNLICNKDQFLNKDQARAYVGHLSVATFDRYVKAGKLPEGKKIRGWKEKVWYPNELDSCIDKILSEKI